MKKIFALILAAMMVFNLSATAFAAESESAAYSVTINEYDVYVEAREASAQELARSGISAQQAALIKSDAIENELSRLSKLSNGNLASLGYTEEQIAIIHRYNGERIETNAELRGIFADMTADFYKVSASTTALAVKVVWEWTNAPVLAGSGIEDMVAMRWQGTNNAGVSINLAFKSAGSSCYLQYYTRDGVYQYTRYPSVVCDSPYDHAYAKIPMSTGDGDGMWQYYAKKGGITVKVERVGSNVINEAAFVFGYGHTVIVASPSLSLPASFGIGFSFGTETMAEEAIRMNSSGKITAY